MTALSSAPSDVVIREVTQPGEISAAFAVMVQLRTHLEVDQFVSQVQRQQKSGYRLVVLTEDGVVRALAGFHLGENLAWGRHCYVADLVADVHCRSRGHGKALMDWLCHMAKEAGCRQLHLDSGVQRSEAHRFYRHRGLAANSYHFSITL